MPILYNWQTKKVENVPDEQVTSGVASGTYAFRSNVRVPVVSPDGQVGTVDSREAPKLMAAGWQYQTADAARTRTQQQIAQVQAEAYDMPVTAALAGAARGFTFGASDVAMRAIGGQQVGEGLLRLREQNRVASTVGEIGGALVGAAIPVGAVAEVANIGKSISTGLRSTKAIESLAQAGKAGEVAAKMLSAGAGSAVEGAFFGAGELLTEAALGDPNLTAQNAAVTFGLNTLLGGAAGGLAEGIGMGVSKLRDLTRKVVVDDLSLPGKAGELYGKALAKLRILNKEDADELGVLFKDTNRNWREQVMHYYDNPSEMIEQGTKQVASLADTGKFEADFAGSIRDTARSELSKIKMAKSVSPLNEVRTVTKGFDNALSAIEKDPTSYLGIRTRLETVRDDFVKAVSESKTLEDLNEAILLSRQNLDSRFRSLFDANKKMMRYEEKETLEILQGVRQEMNGLLKDNKLFGKYAENFAATDDAFSRYLTAAKNFRKEFYTKQAGRGGEEFVFDQAKIKRAVMSPDHNPAKTRALNEMAEATRNLSNVSATFADNPQLSQVVGKHIDDTLAKVDDLKKIRSAQLLLSRLEPTTGKSLTGAALGYAAGELAPTDLPGSGLAGALVGTAFVNPRSALRYLVKLERGNLAATNAVEPAVRKFLGMKVPPVVGDIASVAKPVTLNQLINHLSHDDDEKAPTTVDGIKLKMQQITDPSYADGILVKANPGLDQVAPGTYAGIAQNLQRAAEFVLSKAPIEAPGDLMAGRTRYSHSQESQLQAYAQAAFQPGVIFDELKAGRVRRETVETIATLYPEMHAQLQQAAIEALSEKSRDVKYAKKLELAKLLGIPTTPALAGFSMLQSAYLSESPDGGVPRAGQMRPPQNIAGPSDALLGRRGNS